VGVTFTAAAAYPYVNGERATALLRAQLREVVATAGVDADWATMTVQWPTEAPGARGRTWFKWTATVSEK
jgi:hypothetical protein